MIALVVWRRTPTGDLLRAGEIRVAEPDPSRGGRLRGEFRYDPAYLEHPRALALDPLHLPLTSAVYAAERPRSGIHGVFEDSLPDHWGRGLLIRRYRLPRSRQTPAHLLMHLSQSGLGALAYGIGETPPAPELATIPDTETLIDAAERYDRNPAEVQDEDLIALFRAASSPGGARPKLLIHHAGVSYMAKLGSSRDLVDMVRVEAACLALARDAGLTVPRFQVAEFGRHAALLIERFDIRAGAGRYHTLSLQTLLGAEDWYQLGYPDLADLLRQVSGRPENDLSALYRQLVFNAFIGNTDDHLKNFALLHDGDAWRLTPAYNLTPDEPPRGEHVLHFGSAGHQPNAAALAAMARSFGLSPRTGRRIREQVAEAMVHWRDRFTRFGVSADDLQRLAQDIERRLKICLENFST